MHPNMAILRGMATAQRSWTLTLSGANRGGTAGAVRRVAVRRGTSVKFADFGFGALYGIAPIDGWSLEPGDIDIPAARTYALGESITPQADMTLYPHYAETEIDWPLVNGVKAGVAFAVKDGVTISNQTRYCNDATPPAASNPFVARGGTSCYCLNYNGGDIFTLALDMAEAVAGYVENAAVVRFATGEAVGNTTYKTWTLYADDAGIPGEEVAAFTGQDMGSLVLHGATALGLDNGKAFFHVGASNDRWANEGLTLARLIVR